MSAPVNVAVTGAAGQIGYSLLFRIASGSMLGPDQPVMLQLLEITPRSGGAARRGDGARRLRLPVAGRGSTSATTPKRPSTTPTSPCWSARAPARKGMERKDLLEANGAIFTAQGKALADHAADDIKVLVVGNPANTNALIAMRNAPDIPAERFNALTRLDHNRAKAQLAAKTGVSVDDITHMTIWGNHSATQYPDLFNTLIGGQSAAELINDQQWLESTFLPTVQQRGAAVIGARGASSAASAANATVGHMRDWVLGTPEGDWVSMSVPSDGSYQIPEGLICSVPCTVSSGAYQIVPGLEINDFSRSKIDASVAELLEEREAVRALGLID